MTQSILTPQGNAHHHRATFYLIEHHKSTGFRCIFFHSHDLPLKIDLQEVVPMQLILHNILVQTQILRIIKLLYGKT